MFSSLQIILIVFNCIPRGTQHNGNWPTKFQLNTSMGCKMGFQLHVGFFGNPNPPGKYNIPAPLVYYVYGGDDKMLPNMYTV